MGSPSKQALSRKPLLGLSFGPVVTPDFPALFDLCSTANLIAIGVQSGLLQIPGAEEFYLPRGRRVLYKL